VLNHVDGVTNQKELARCAWLVLYHNRNVDAVLGPESATASKVEGEARSRIQDCLIQMDKLLASKEA